MLTVVLETANNYNRVPGSKKRLRFWNNKSKARGRAISQDQILGEGDYATIERQTVYDDHTLDLCHTAALNAWDRTGEIGKKTE